MLNTQEINLPSIEDQRLPRSLDISYIDLPGLIPNRLCELFPEEPIQIRAYDKFGTVLNALVVCTQPLGLLTEDQTCSFLNEEVPRFVEEGILDSSEEALMKIQMLDYGFKYPIVWMDHFVIHPALRGKGIGRQFYSKSLPSIASRYGFKAVAGSNRNPKFFLEDLGRVEFSQLDERVFGDLQYYQKNPSIVTVGFFEEAEKNKYLKQ